MRIAGGREVKLGEFPYVVGIRTSQSESPFCVGGLISTEHVITAAHCLTNTDYDTDAEKPENLEVLVGVVKSENYTAESVVKVRSIFIHRKYIGKPDFEYDIAIIALATNVTLSENVQTISIYDGEVKPGMILTAVGWGYTDKNEVQPTNARTVEIPVVQCTTSPTLFCAGEGHGKDTCEGDSGGVVAVKQNGTFLAVGIVSNGEGQCGAEGATGQYTLIKSFIDWIKTPDMTNVTTSSAATLFPTRKIIMSVLLLSLPFILF